MYYCFPADATMFVDDDQGLTTVKRMDELEVGDWVRSFHGKNEVVKVPVTYWLHRDPDQEAVFVEFSLDNGEKFSLTEKHLIYVGECKVNKSVDINSNPIAADKVQVGDCFYINHRTKETIFQMVQVLAIDRVKKTGIYAPMTNTGNIIVNRIHTSCHSESNIHSLVNTFFESFLTIKNQIAEQIFGKTTTELNISSGFNEIVDLLHLVLPSPLI
uniref:HintN domain-containing protein n=2 Tax=Caenorhabditis tropicalis TaxID=1561998 RepID=A0A1I7TRS7_9PELO